MEPYPEVMADTGFEDGQKCVICGLDAVPSKKSEGFDLQRLPYCAACGGMSTAERKQLVNPHMGKFLSSVIGSASEMVASADLLLKGYQVFRAVAPSCPCDLIAMNGQEVFRVEVKTGMMNIGKGMIWPKPKDPSKFDVLAVVELGEKKVTYTPELPDIQGKERK